MTLKGGDSMYLRKIQPSIQQVVMAISSALKIEVEIADRDLLRIAGTGVIKSNIWQEMRNEDFVYRRCLETGKPIVIKNPGYHEVCQPCSRYQNCPEVGEVCCPIKVDGVVVGVIGLLAFNNDQKERLFVDLQANLEFLEKMSELIALKVKEYNHHQEQLLNVKKISTLIHYIDNGTLMINREGTCEYINPAARQLLGLSSDEIPNQELINQLINSLAASGEKIEGQPIVLFINGKFKNLFAAFHPLSEQNEDRSAVIILTDPAYIANAASKLTEGSYTGFERIVGTHSSIKSLKELARKVAHSQSSIHIRGEKGTGKELFASSIHEYSIRKTHKFISMNCAVLPEEILERELFPVSDPLPGTERKKSKLEMAQGGTLFLDEIHDMPLSIQLRLLRVMEEVSLECSDGRRIPLNIRFITATDKDLEDLIMKGLFRQDLYYRLNIIPFTMPPLRERKEDILLLANHFLQKHSRITRKFIRAFDEDVKSIFLSYHWPGNIRELSNIVEYAVNIETKKIIVKESLPRYLQNLVVQNNGSLLGEQYFNLRLIEKETIRRALNETKKRGESKEKAAELLGISRATLFRKLNEYQI
jgi:transcriptional regulator with PAS, ATPase and Fis domain